MQYAPLSRKVVIHVRLMLDREQADQEAEALATTLEQAGYTAITRSAPLLNRQNRTLARVYLQIERPSV